MVLTVVALRPLAAGEEVTVDYVRHGQEPQQDWVSAGTVFLLDDAVVLAVLALVLAHGVWSCRKLARVVKGTKT